ncbi:MAG: hypothetical protein ACFE9C_05765 [Candidatus Hodarchaeota archaeon]
MNEHTSFGRRGFNVCLHHSNKFGVVLTNDRTTYHWNCTQDLNAHDYQAPQQPFHFPFDVNNRQGSFLYIYE